MSKNTTTVAKHFYAGAYADYLRDGNLEEATRKVAHDIYLRRGGAPGNAQTDWAEAERLTMDWPHTITDASQSHLFDKALAKTREWLKDIESELGFTNPNEAYRALRAVLHAIRDRLPVKETADFAAQLPMMIAGVYYSGWSPNDKPVRMRHVSEFIDRVEMELPKSMDPVRVTQGIIRVMERHVSRGEMDDVKRNLPGALQEFWAESRAEAGKR